MKKILLAVDGPQFSEGDKNTLLFLASKMKISVTGAFLENEFKYKMTKILHEADSPERSVKSEYDTFMENTVHSFQAFCTQHKIPHQIHEITEGYNQDSLLLETRFADLMVISSEQFFHFENEMDLNPFVQKLFRNSECPILVIPESFHGIESILLTFDNTTSSVFAIKQFSYLFPDLLNLPTTLVSGIDDINHKEQLAAMTLMEDLGQNRFRNFTSVHLPDLTPKELESYAEKKNSPIVVMGSFGRSELSMVWRGSFSQYLIREHKVPLYIAHK